MYITINDVKHDAFQVFEKTSMGNMPVPFEYCIVTPDKVQAREMMKSTDTVWLTMNDKDVIGVISKRIEVLQNGTFRITYTKWETATPEDQD